MNKIILLGGTGFLGKALFPLLQKEGFKIITMIHKNHSKLSSDIFLGDISNPKILDSQLEDNDVIINLIGQYDQNLSQFIQKNILGAINILNSAIKKKNIKIILISSISVYGENLDRPSKESDELNPKTTYGFVKNITEQIYQNYFKLYNIDITVLRLSTLYGPFKKTGFIPNMINSINKNIEMIIYNNGNQIRDMLFVEDAAKGIIQAIKNSQKGFSIFNISSSKQYTIKEIIEMVEKISQHKIPIKFSSEIPDEKILSADNSIAQKVLQFKPHMDIEEGLKITINDLLKK